MASIDIDEKLRQLIDVGFTNEEMAEMLNVSERTVKRRRRQLHLRKKDLESNMSDAQLDDTIKAILQQNPNYGERMVSGCLKSRNINISRERIRLAVRRVDPEGVERRKKIVIKRREYRVAGPNSLWHIDGNHKLIRWRFVIHGGIDGYSRIPVYLTASSNNRADTVLQAFTKAVEEFGLPQRVRSDKGGENTLVCDFMLQHPLRGPGRGSFIAGSSVHNQRIERLWRDVYTSCLSTYYELFSRLEEEGRLDCCDEADLFSLHFVFEPIIEKDLQTFKASYMHHKVRTAGNKTPMQLWVDGVNHGCHVDFLDEEDIAQYGVEEEGNGEEEEEEADRITVPTMLVLSDEQFTSLTSNFSRNENLQSDDDKVSYYEAVRDYIHSLL